jgi:hypothetical protein
VPKMELCAQDTRHFIFSPARQDDGEGGHRPTGLCSENKIFTGTGEGRRGESFFFGRGSVAPSTRSASQTAIEPIVSVNILISHIPPCIAPYTLISRTPPPPTPVGGITPNSSQFIVRLVVNQPEPTRSIRVLRSRLLFERNTDS